MDRIGLWIVVASRERDDKGDEDAKEDDSQRDSHADQDDQADSEVIYREQKNVNLV